jgi:hypothetical protein
MSDTRLEENHLKLPVGTTAERPSPGEPGAIRKNSSTGYIEYWDDDNQQWIGIGEFFTDSTNSGSHQYTENGITYQVVYWTQSGTLTVIQGVKEIDYTIVAGGGSGSKAHNTNTCGGGGAGGVISSLSSDAPTASSRVTLTPGVYNIIIGAGGTCSTDSGNIIGNPGSNSSAFGLTAIGGGAGQGPGATTINGGSGGGAASHDGTEISGSRNMTGGTAVSGQGNDGGTALGLTYLETGGAGGGGAGGVGQNTPSNGTGAAGGAAKASLIRGPSFVYARSGGGGGTGWQTAAGGAGGTAQYTGILESVSGGTAGSQSTNGTNGNRGGGGGAAKSPTIAGNGGGGIVIARWIIAQ